MATTTPSKLLTNGDQSKCCKVGEPRKLEIDYRRHTKHDGVDDSSFLQLQPRFRRYILGVDARVRQTHNRPRVQPTTGGCECKTGHVRALLCWK